MNPDPPLPSFRPLHMGVAVRDLKAALAFYVEELGFKVLLGPVDDPIQQVTVCFIGAAGGGEIELISPLGGQSPVARYLAQGIGAYHVCYEVSNIEHALHSVRKSGCLIVSEPVPATAFGGRRIAWFYTPTKHLIEILEAGGDSF
jgi:methylmalonyl-CoA/ethylmalonyl-CoA epimerase